MLPSCSSHWQEGVSCSKHCSCQWIAHHERQSKLHYKHLFSTSCQAFVGLRVRVLFQQCHSKLPCTSGLLHLIHHLRWGGACFLPNSSCAPMRFCHVSPLPFFPVSAAVGSLWGAVGAQADPPQAQVQLQSNSGRATTTTWGVCGKCFTSCPKVCEACLTKGVSLSFMLKCM